MWIIALAVVVILIIGFPIWWLLGLLYEGIIKLLVKGGMDEYSARKLITTILKVIIAIAVIIILRRVLHC